MWAEGPGSRCPPVRSGWRGAGGGRAPARIRSRPARNARVTSSSPASVMLPSCTVELPFEDAAVRGDQLLRVGVVANHEVDRAAVDALQRFLHPLSGEHAAVVVGQDEARLTGQPRRHDRRQDAHQHQRDRERRLGEQQLAPQGHAAPSSSIATTCTSMPVRLADQPHRDGTPEELLPRRLERTADDQMADAVRAREIQDRLDGIGRAQAHHLRAQLAGEVRVGEQVALRLRVDLLRRFLRASRRRRRTSRC